MDEPNVESLKKEFNSGYVRALEDILLIYKDEYKEVLEEYPKAKLLFYLISKLEMKIERKKTRT